MTTIYLIRHAEAEGNLYRIAQGQDDSILTDRGWRQVKALERRFDGVQIDAVYTSDLYRTRATASALYLPRNLTPHLVRDLREIHVGVWERRTWGEIARRWPDQMSDFSRRMDRWHMEGAETPAQVLERALGAVQKIAAENGGKTVAVFSHGYVIRLLLANLQGVSLRDTGDKSPTGDNTAVSLLEWDGETLRVVRQNDNSHLLTPEYLSGEKVRRRASGLEPGLYFAPLRLPEQPQAAYEQGGQWLAELKLYLDENFRFAKEYLGEHLPKAVFRIPEATYLGWVDIGAYVEQGEDLPLLFANEAAVLLEGGNMFVQNSDTYIRLNLACPRAMLAEGLRRICELLNKRAK